MLEAELNGAGMPRDARKAKAMKRRAFVKTTALGAAAVALQGAPSQAAAAKMPLRSYGRDGVRLSIIGFPGLVLRNMEQERANRLVADSVERGVNYFDVAPAYGDAEVKLGPALEPYRKNVFLACKTKARDAEGAEVEFKRSLARLRTDHFDLYQLHCLKEVGRDVDAAFSKGGVMAFIADQQKAGRVKYVGFTAHTEEAALAALERFRFDSVLFPISFASWMKMDFGPKVVKAARARGTAVLAMKGLCRNRWTKDDPLRKRFRMWYRPVHDRGEATLALRFTLSQAVVAAVPPSNETVHRLALDLVPTIRPITEAETAKLQALAMTLDPLFPEGPRKA